MGARLRSLRARYYARLNLARLNHVLIPSTKDGRDRLRHSPLGRLLRPLGYAYETLSSEGAVFALAALVAGVFGLDVRATQTHVLWAALVALLGASLLASRLYRASGLRLEVSAPPRVTVGEELVFEIQVLSSARREHQCVRLLGPFLPWDGRWSSARRTLPAIAPGGAVRAEMRARFAQRGEHHLDAFRAAALVPFGLALGPSVYSPGSRFLVVPRIARVTRVTLPLGSRHQPGGVALASKTGESLDLLGVRPYRPGDPVRDLHARSWARLGAPVVREFQQEHFTRIGVVLDTDLGDGDPQWLEAAISLSAGIIARLTQGEALVDLWVAGAEQPPLALGRSLGAIEQALDLLACVREGEPLRAEALLARLDRALPRLSCVVLVVLRWDRERAEIERRVRLSGARSRVIAVGEGAQGAGLQCVSAAAVLRGEAIAL